MYNNIWTQHLQTEEGKQRFIHQLQGSRDVFERLTTLIEGKEKELGASERNMSTYDSPNWAYLQAHKNGYASAMNVIKNLLHLDQQKQ